MIVEQQFHGPPQSGNGGYSCGLIAEQLDFTAEISLRQPIPLDTPLELQQQPDGSYQLLAQEALIATLRPSELALELPPPISFQAASHASQHYIGHQQALAYPSCFVCGPQRAKGEGLHIFAGPVADTPYYAAPWQPAAHLADATGQIPLRFIWAALDCPGAYAAMGQKAKNLLLGRMCAQAYRPLPPLCDTLVMAWCISQEGRKSVVGTALFNTHNQCIAAAQATWIEVKE